MRISTNTMYDMGVAGMQQASYDMIRTQQQIAVQRRILTPSDDPVAAARVLEVTQAQSLNVQYDTNIRSATSSLRMEDTILSSVTSLLIGAKGVAVTSQNTTLDGPARHAIATELRGRYQELLGLANSTDGNGQYLFSGYQGSTKPFVADASDPPVVSYSGDDGQRLVQVNPSRQIAMSDSGSDVFQSSTVDIFNTLRDLIGKLEINTPADATDLKNLDDSLQNVLKVRGSVGTRMNELKIKV